MECITYSMKCGRNCSGRCACENSYRPSNGTEGMSFEEDFCMQCLHCDPNPEGKKQCEILLAALCFYPPEPEYPKEWVYNSEGKPVCTNWVKWDWDTNGDPDDPDNPNKPPDPPDPNQLYLFPLYPNELQYGQQQEIQHKEPQSTF